MELGHAEYHEMFRFEDRYWWYRGRRELLLDAVDAIRRDSGRESLTILDSGCGTGLNLQYLAGYGKAVGSDISPAALRLSRSRGEYGLLCALCERLPIRSGTFDIVCSLDVLEHIDDDRSAVLEAHRILKPGGRFLLTVPAFEALWSGHDLALKHKRRYRLSTLVPLLRECGFVVERQTYWNLALFPLVFLVRLSRRHRQNGVRTDIEEFPGWLNAALHAVLKGENSLIREGRSLPFGVSAFCVCRKPH